MVNVNAIGLTAVLKASKSFPAGFIINQWADDADPVDAAEMQIASTGVALNGDLVHWKNPISYQISISVLPGTDESNNLENLADFNRAGKNKVATEDVITIVFTYPNGDVRTAQNGVLTSAPNLVVSSTADGRKKTRTYTFVFESVV